MDTQTLTRPAVAYGDLEWCPTPSHERGVEDRLVASRHVALQHHLVAILVLFVKIALHMLWCFGVAAATYWLIVYLAMLVLI